MRANGRQCVGRCDGPWMRNIVSKFRMGWFVMCAKCGYHCFGCPVRNEEHVFHLHGSISLWHFAVCSSMLREHVPNGMEVAMVYGLGCHQHSHHHHRSHTHNCFHTHDVMVQGLEILRRCVGWCVCSWVPNVDSTVVVGVFVRKCEMRNMRAIHQPMSARKP